MQFLAMAERRLAVRDSRSCCAQPESKELGLERAAMLDKHFEDTAHPHRVEQPFEFEPRQKPFRFGLPGVVNVLKLVRLAEPQQEPFLRSQPDKLQTRFSPRVDQSGEVDV